jgi:hypothetical protein
LLSPQGGTYTSRAGCGESHMTSEPSIRDVSEIPGLTNSSDRLTGAPEAKAKGTVLR